MKIPSLLRSLRKKFFGGATPRRKPFRRTSALFLEPLESRTLPALIAPKVLSVSPPNLTVWDSSKQPTPSPPITITFNEAMYNPNKTDPHSVTNPANYTLFNDITGTTVAITSITYVANADPTKPSTATLNYATGPGNVLTDGTYTVFIEADNLFELTNVDSIAQPGQLVVSNPTNGTVSTINASPITGPQAAQSYPIGNDPNFGGTPLAAAVAVADLNGDGIADIAVACSALDSVEIFLGQASGGFNFTPDTILYTTNLPTAITGIVAANLGQPFGSGSGLPDLVTCDTDGEVNVFENDTITGSGTLDFANGGFGVDYAAGTSTVGIVAANFDGGGGFGGGTVDIAVANGVADASGNYDVTILFGNGDATLGNVETVIVGKTSGVGVLLPTGLATGDLNNDKRPDLIVSGSNGVLPFLNTGLSGGVLTFLADGTGAGGTTPLDVGGGAPVAFNSVAVGPLTPASVASGVPDIAVTSVGANSTLYVFANNGTGGFSGTPSASVALNGSARSVALTDLNNDGLDEAVVASPSSNAVEVVVNTTSGGTLSFNAPVSYQVDNGPVALATGILNGGTTPSVVTANITVDALGNVVTGPSFSTILGNGDGTLADLTLADTVSEVTKTTPNPGPSAIAVGDLNGDGIPDLVVADTGADQVEVYLATAPGVYAAPIVYSVLNKAKNGGTPVSVALANLTGLTYANGLPILDVVTADDSPDTNGNYYISVLANKGDGSGILTAAKLFQVGQNPTQVVAGLFKANAGKTAADLLVAHNGLSSKGVTLLINNSSGGVISFQTAVEVPVTGSNSSFSPSAIAVGDFNNDGNLDFALLNSNTQAPSVYLAEGNGLGAFPNILGPYNLSANLTPSALAVGDFNRDGFLDLVVVGQPQNSTTAAVETLLNNHGFGFQSSPVVTDTAIPGDAIINSVAVTDVNGDPYPDIIVGTLFTALSDADPATVDNLFTLQGVGDGTFTNAAPYEAGGEPGPPPSLVTVPVNIAVISDPFIPVLTFYQTGPLVTTNLITNGGFETPDLSGEAGNLDGWQTASETNSNGEWVIQQKTNGGGRRGNVLSPLSGTSVIRPPSGQYQAMLDEYNLIPYVPGGGFGGFNPNPNGAESYEGSNFLYQTFTLPTGTKAATLTLSLYINNTTGTWFAGPVVGNPLDYNVPTNNEQVLVDFIANPANSQDVTTASSLTGGIVFQTTATTAAVISPKGTKPNITFTLSSAFLSAYAGQTIALRIAAVNNQAGPLIVGVDNVQLSTTFNDTTPPKLTGLQLRNPGALISGLQTTTDTTIIGRVTDAGGVGAISAPGFVQISTPNTTLNGQDITFVTQFDSEGNFAVQVPNLAFGIVTLTVIVQNQAGNSIQSTLTFFNQGLSLTGWQAVGPGAISTAGQDGVAYSSVSGRVTAIAVDPSDPSGNTIYAGSENGGVWKSSDGGANWTPLTDFVTNQAGQPVNVPVGALAVSPTNPSDVFVATGDGNLLADALGGVGVLFSTNGGKTWKVNGNSGTVLAGARITAMAVDPNDPNVVYVAVAAGGSSGPGVYRTLNALAASPTWTDILSVANMSYPRVPGNPGGPVAPGTLLASVTSLALDPFNSKQLIIGLGNIGLVNPSTTAGVWLSANANNLSGNVTWTAIIGGDNAAIPNNKLPQGLGVGRVTVAEGIGVGSGEKVFYILIGNPTSATPISGGSELFGTAVGLYKTSDGGLNFTKVSLMQQTNVTVPDSAGNTAPIYSAINLLGEDAGNAGSLIVDPTNPNVVYVGGSISFDEFNANLDHGLVAVNTGDMLDASPAGLAAAAGINFEANVIDGLAWNATNNGDDIQKEETAFGGPFKGFYDPTINSFKYTGEGVSWYDVSTGEYSGDQPWFDPAIGSFVDPGGNNGFGGNGTGFSSALLPGEILTLTADSQGRILIGTEQGIWRATVHSAGYDFSSGGGGIMSIGGGPGGGGGGGGLSPPATSVTITTLNSNMQITDLTSVAIDPQNSGSFYAAGYGSGIERTSSGGGLLTWETMGLNGPNGQVDAGTVLTAAPSPTSPIGTPTSLYVNWSYNIRGSGYAPQVSTQGGAPGTFSTVDAPGISINDKAGFFPVLNIDPTKVVNNTGGNLTYYDELFFGTDDVYYTPTKAQLWVTLNGGQPLDKASDSVITAAAIAPSNSGFFYVGTANGKVFVSQNTGADQWPESDTGLPTGIAGADVTSIAVDPKNPLVAFVTFGGTGSYGHLWKTSDGGKTWTNLQGTTQGLTLPSVPAYTVVTDPRPQAGAPNGHIYVGTEVGAFVSLDGGKTWKPLGNGLPNVPVVALNFNQSLEELVAGTQGRGVFVISTDHIGAHVVSVSPATVVLPGISSVSVTFNKAIASFPLSQVISITGPNGVSIKATSVTDVTPVVQGQANAHNVFQISFPAQTADGAYTFVIGPKILDNTGNPMDQNQNKVNGEVPGDRYTFQIAISSTDDGQFVTGLYNDLLNESAPVSAFLSAMNVIETARFAQLPGIAGNYLSSAAARTQLINDLYSSSGPTSSTLGIANLFGVAPTTAQLNSALSLLQQGSSIESLLANLISNSQFFGLAAVNEMDPAFVTQAYIDLLGSGPNSTQLNAAVAQLSNAEAASRLKVANAFVNSNAYIDNFVENGYFTFLGVAPSPATLTSWEAAFRSGTTQQTFNATLMGSTAYYNNAPNIITPFGQSPPPASPTVFIQAVYQQLFNGTPGTDTATPAQVKFWLGQFAAGVTHQQMVQSLEATDAYREGLITSTYLTYLNRVPLPNQLAGWNSSLAAGFPVQGMVANILASNEFFSNQFSGATKLSDQDLNWVTQMYLQGSGLAPTQAQRDNALASLAAAERAARQVVVQGLTSGSAYRTRMINFVFTTYYNRLPLASQLANWQTYLAGPSNGPGTLTRDETMVANILGSQEYFFDQTDGTGLHTNTAWVDSLYTSLRIEGVLNDPTDPFYNPDDATNHVNQLLAKYASQRTTVTQGILHSTAYRTLIITQDFQTYLQRPPTQKELSSWLANFAAGYTREFEIANLISTPEFFKNAPTILGSTADPSNTLFVQAAYAVLYPWITTVPPSVFQYWVPRLQNKTATPLQFTQTLIGGGFLFAVIDSTHGVVNSLYNRFLGTNATAKQIASWQSVYTGITYDIDDIVIASLLSTPAYFLKAHPFP